MRCLRIAIQACLESPHARSFYLPARGLAAIGMATASRAASDMLLASHHAIAADDCDRESDGMTLTDVAGWIAPVATMIAAMMTAANLGARVTGWGFVVFTVGSVGWSIVGLGSGQTNLIATNAFLTIVNGIGIWRWLGRQVAYEDGGESAMRASRRKSAPSLFTGTGIAGMIVNDRAGEEIGKAVEALIECDSGTVSYVVVATSDIAGTNEILRAVRKDRITFSCDALILSLSSAEFEALAILKPGAWPATIDP